MQPTGAGPTGDGWRHAPGGAASLEVSVLQAVSCVLRRWVQVCVLMAQPGSPAQPWPFPPFRPAFHQPTAQSWTPSPFPLPNLQPLASRPLLPRAVQFLCADAEAAHHFIDTLLLISGLALTVLLAARSPPFRSRTCTLDVRLLHDASVSASRGSRRLSSDAPATTNADSIVLIAKHWGESRSLLQ